MTTPSLFDLPPSEVESHVYRSPQGERSGKKTRTELVIDYFMAHPNEWIDGLTIAAFAGQYAWRSRISDVRKTGMEIDNRQRMVDGYVVSEYRYVPSSSSPTGKPRT